MAFYQSLLVTNLHIQKYTIQIAEYYLTIKIFLRSLQILGNLNPGLTNNIFIIMNSTKLTFDVHMN